MIEAIRDYIATCNLLDEYTELNVNYLVDNSNAYSINEETGYNPVIETNITGEKYMQFIFNFDSRLVWNEDMANNIANSKFYENFSEWLNENNDKNIFPEVDGIIPESIKATTNGFIFVADSNEAIYRISCTFTYLKQKTTQQSV